MMTRCGWMFAGAISVAVFGGCSGEKTAVSPPSPPATANEPASPPSETAPQLAGPPVKELLHEAKSALAAENLAEARRLVEALRGIESLPEDEQTQLSELESELAALLDRETDAERANSLQQVAGLIANGKLDQAATALDETAARKPTDEQRRQIAEFREQIERIRGAQRKLGAWMKLMGSKQRSELRAAQNALLEEPEAALPLLIDAVREPGDKQRTLNLLETLRQLRRPQAALPAIVGVLERTEQRESWPDAIETLSRIHDDGAGPLLLQLWTAAREPEQRAAALSALSRVSDPPAETTLALLPRLFENEDSADLPATLACIVQSARRHGQTDLVALHGFGANVTAEQSRQLAALPARLDSWRSSADENISRAATMLSIALGLIAPQPLSGVQVLNVSAEYPDSPGAAAVDGVWNSVDLKTMWYHPLGGDSQIVLDLGGERTVTGVVVWNFNQQGGGFRGWKTAEIFISPTPTALDPVTSGVIAMAPGVADPADYGTLISVPCITGRYVKLKAKDLWNPNAYTGLAEVQVLGF